MTDQQPYPDPDDDDGAPYGGTGPNGMARWHEAAPFAALVLGLAAFFAAGGERFVTADALAAHGAALGDWAARNPGLAPAAFMGVTAAAAAISIPGAAVLAIAGGLMFGVWAGAGLYLAGATGGAVVMFLAAGQAFGGMMRRRASPQGLAMLTAFRRDGFFWVLAMRLLPVLPTFLVTLIPAFLAARPRAFAAATALGMAPGAVIFAWAGARLGDGQTPALDALYGWPQVAVLTGLAGLAILPVIVRALRRR